MLTRDKEKVKEEILKEFFKTIFKSEPKYCVPLADICHEFIDSFMDACSKSKNFEDLLENCFERIDEYTDRHSSGSPDFYLRSKVDGVPDLAIEIETSEWIDSPDLKHKLTIRDIEFFVRVKVGFLIPKEAIKLWDELGNEFRNFKRELEYIAEAVNTIEEKLKDENQDMDLKNLSYDQKEELTKVVNDVEQKIIYNYNIEQEDKEFVKCVDFVYTLWRFEKSLREDRDDIRIADVIEEIKGGKRKFLIQCVKNFLEDYFNKKVCRNLSSSCIARIELEESTEPEELIGQKNQSVFIVCFNPMWGDNIDYYIKIVEESKRKFENLKKIKSNKLDKNHYLEFLLIKVTSFVNKTPEDHAKELQENLAQRGYNYPFCPVKNLNNSSGLSKSYLICTNDEMKSINK